MKPQGEAGWIYDPFAGIERVRTEMFAFMTEIQAAYKGVNQSFTDSQKCSFREFPTILLYTSTFPVEKNSGNKEIMKVRLLRQKEVGFAIREKNRFVPKKSMWFEAIGLVNDSSDSNNYYFIMFKVVELNRYEIPTVDLININAPNTQQEVGILILLFILLKSFHWNPYAFWRQSALFNRTWTFKLITFGITSRLYH